MAKDTIELEGHIIEFSNRDKVFFPDGNFTKGDLVNYYAKVAETALPHYRGRALTMQRFPDGIAEDGFFQKHASDYFPEWIETVELEKEGGTVRQVVINGPATLVYLADQGLITPHLGLSRVDKVHAPDRMIFDLDPSDDDFAKVQQAAQRLRSHFEQHVIEAFVQTTGSRGLHVVVPLERSATFDEVRRCAQQIAKTLSDADPDHLTTEQRKANRGDRVYLDTARNAYGQTAVAPYAVRALPDAPIATPLDWDEALRADMTPQRYTIGNIFRRLGQTADPWQDIDKAASPLKAFRACERRLR
jgi:bifunctional non-homologous end joining protein LigD